MSFIHLHNASAFSLKYGTTQPADLVERASQLEAPALALTDRDGLLGAIRFTKACLKYGIAPIIGVNLAIDLQSDLQKSRIADDKKLPRLTLIAGSDGGWRDLVRLMSSLNLSTGAPVLTLDFLERFSQYTQNLYVLHGLDSPMAPAIAAHRNDSALAIFNKTRDFFKAHAIECVSHLAKGDGPGSLTHAGRSLIFARDHDIDAVITNAVRMRGPEDGPVADILDCARQLVPLHPRHIGRTNAEAYLKSTPAMHALADEIARAGGERNARTLLSTTRAWAEQTLLSPTRDIGLGSIHLPEAHVVGVENAQEMRALLRQRSEAKINWRYSSTQAVKSARERLDDELATVATLGYESYFLTVADIADIARERGIRVSARGSGAGSLICHLLGISGVDPMAHGLLMERFCSPLRRALPDIDIDVESHRRLEIYDLVFKKYGDPRWDIPGNQSRCATVASFDTYRTRQSIRDAGAALGLPAAEINLIAKSPYGLREQNVKTPLAKMVITMARRLEGLPRHLSMHPCAIVLSDGGLLDRAPLQRNASGYPMVEFDKDDVEDIGLLKLDILGVRMQSSISYALSEISRVHKEEIDIDAISLDDPHTYELIQSTKTIGIFQIESPGQRELVGKLEPQTFTDLIIDISLFRPGPVKSDMISPFLKSRHGWSTRKIIHPDLYEILRDTEGVVVFHEQVISIIATMTHCSLAHADEMRRALGDRQDQQRVCDWFYPAATEHGYALEVINEVWEVLRAFASFGFCKAHAAAFAFPTYQSAWLKTHYPAAFLAGVLTHDPGMYPKRLILDEVRQMGIPIAPLDVNYSDQSYRVELSKDGTQSIRIALSTINGISADEIESIVTARPYKDLADFYYRSGASQPIIESLILTGAFDRLHAIVKGGPLNRRDLLLHLSDLIKGPTMSSALRSQMTLGFDAPALESSGLPDLVSSEVVAHEVQRLGMDITHHMLEFYSHFLNSIGAIKSSDLLSVRSASTVLVAGVRVSIQTPPVRSGKRVIFLTLNDGHGCSDATFFSDIATEYLSTIYTSELVLLRGVTRRTGARGISIRATGIWDLRAAYEKWNSQRSTLAI